MTVATTIATRAIIAPNRGPSLSIAVKASPKQPARPAAQGVLYGQAAGTEVGVRRPGPAEGVADPPQRDRVVDDRQVLGDVKGAAVLQEHVGRVGSGQERRGVGNDDLV